MDVFALFDGTRQCDVCMYVCGAPNGAPIEHYQPWRVVAIVGGNRESNLLMQENVIREPCRIMEQYQQISSPHLAFAAARSEGCEHRGRHQNILR